LAERLGGQEKLGLIGGIILVLIVIVGFTAAVLPYSSMRQTRRTTADEIQKLRAEL
jgi:hypothetical protein